MEGALSVSSRDLERKRGITREMARNYFDELCDCLVVPRSGRSSGEFGEFIHLDDKRKSSSELRTPQSAS